MAIKTWTNGYISIGGVDLSNHGHMVSVNMGQDTQDATTFGDTHHKSRAGLGRRVVAATFFNDMASGNVEATLRATIVGSSSTGVAVEVRPDNSATTGVNPRYYGEMILDGDLQVVNIGAVGGLQDVSVTFVPYGTFAVSTTSS